MNQEYFEKLSNMAKKAQEPFQAMTKLNAETLQSFTYIKQEDFSKITKPEEYLEKQLEMVVANGHKALDYMQKMTKIYEKALLSFVEESKIKTDGKK
jgi:hypothetical protein